LSILLCYFFLWLPSSKTVLFKKLIFFKKKFIICQLVIKTLTSLFVALFFVVELSRSHISYNKLVKLTIVALDFFLTISYFDVKLLTLELCDFFHFSFFLGYPGCVLIKLTRVSLHVLTQYFFYLTLVFFARSFF